MLEKIFGSKARVKILTLFSLNYNEEFYLREIARSVKLNVNSVRRELNNLEEFGFLKSEKRDRLKYYVINKDFFLCDEIANIFIKSEANGEIIKSKLSNIDEIETAFIYGNSLFNHLHENVDLLLIGNVKEEIIIKELSKVEKKISRKINFNILSQKELNQKVKEEDIFIREVLNNSKKFIIGESSDLVLE
ncbi:MAG: winged helix-turn-helix domain-containing protein [Methanobrevibacter sp.]|jgi:NADH/NAD ratio-sensing transcriptional regulator Rex|nr:winged helix-turn-helix domain-containing protein [Methanobrevibacter sp.]